jgi:excisionase family DNA binding protein
MAHVFTQSATVGVADAARLVGVGAETIKRWSLDGRFPERVDLGSTHWRFNRDEVLDFVHGIRKARADEVEFRAWDLVEAFVESGVDEDVAIDAVQKFVREQTVGAK